MLNHRLEQHLTLPAPPRLPLRRNRQMHLTIRTLVQQPQLMSIASQS
jgi:hypothetical protein